MTKEELAKLGIVIDTDEVTNEEAMKLITDKLGSVNAENQKTKKLLETRNSEIAEWKRKENEKLSEEEKTKLRLQELEEKNKTFARQIALTEKENSYIGIGYSPELAKKIAEAELDGKSTAELHKQHIVAREEKLRAELLRNGDDPKVNNNDPNNKFTKENFKKGLISMEEMNSLKQTNPALYKEIISG